MAYTITSGTGSNVAFGTNPTPAYPSTGMGSGRLAILHTGLKNDGSGSLTPPGGWTLQGNNVANGNDKSAIYSKILDGTETPGGTITVTSTGSQGRRAARIYVINTDGSGWNFSSATDEQSSLTTTISDNNVTTGGSNRLAMNFIYYGTRQTGGQEDFAGETGGSWIATSFYDGGANPTLSLQTSELSSAGTIGGGSDTSITSSAWVTHGLSIWRNTSVLPDLTVSDITWDPPTIAVGKPTTFSAEITNTGSGASPDNVQHGVKFEVSGTPVAFSTTHMESIAGSNGTAVVFADNAWTPSASGNPNVVATVDYSGLITESNDANNTRSEAITIVDLPNLVVTDITYTPASPVVGDSVSLTAVVGNTGLGASPGSTPHVVHFEISGTQVAVSTNHTSSIAASGSANITADATWIPGSSGTFSMNATVNPGATILETTTSDNTFSESISIASAGAGTITKFAGRGPNANGEIWPLLGDYDEFFLTQGEGDERYLQAVPTEYLTQDEGDSRYLQSVPSEYITQTEADAQGMPAIEAGGTGATTVPVREVNANFTLLAASSGAYYWQSYFNTSASTVTASKPTGYLDTVGSVAITTNTSALFIKRAGVSQFRRWS